ncbi:VgrG protein, partial [Yersinia rochesterensis]|nr:VgrG protein [Yersinia rochesterensis]
LKIEAGKIEYGTASQYLRKVKRTAATPPNTLPLNTPLLPGQYPPLQGEVCIECLLNAIKANDAMVQGA